MFNQSIALVCNVNELIKSEVIEAMKEAKQLSRNPNTNSKS